MLWLYVSLGVVGLAVAGRIAWRHHMRKRAAAEELESVRTVIAEDLALLEAEYRRLPDAPGMGDYDLAGKAYESARNLLLDAPASASAITRELADGQYAVLRYTSSLAGRPPPERRLPCFFNPPHGPSRADVLWTEPGRGTRKVPACTDDIARINAGDEPLIRLVNLSGHRVPYWAAGSRFAPYGLGYFSRAQSTQQFLLTNFGGQDSLVYGDQPLQRNDRTGMGGWLGPRSPKPPH